MARVSQARTRAALAVRAGGGMKAAGASALVEDFGFSAAGAAVASGASAWGAGVSWVSFDDAADDDAWERLLAGVRLALARLRGGVVMVRWLPSGLRRFEIRARRRSCWNRSCRAGGRCRPRYVEGPPGARRDARHRALF